MDNFKKIRRQAFISKAYHQIHRIQQVLIDDLHLLLRVTDKLLKLLLLKFIRLEKV